MQARKLIASAALLTAFANGPLFAQGPAYVATPAASAPIVPRAGFGGETDVWLAIQTSPAYTANDPRPIPGEVANRTYVRYLNSFTHPIPEQFDRQTFIGNGGGSNSGGGNSGSGGGSNSGSGTP